MIIRLDNLQNLNLKTIAFLNGKKIITNREDLLSQFIDATFETWNGEFCDDGIYFLELDSITYLKLRSARNNIYRDNIDNQNPYLDLDELLDLLLSEKGCPWDRQQTLESLRGNVLEEAFEVVSAIDNKDLDNLVEEVGDLILQPLFLSRILFRDSKIKPNQAMECLIKKLVYRHPHVFEGDIVTNGAEALKSWENKKPKEFSKLKGLPSLYRAYKLQKKAGSYGFDWDSKIPVLDKIIEEVNEFKEAILKNEDYPFEFGDILFSLVNLSRHMGINPELELNRSNDKFYERFVGVLELAKARHLELETMDIDEIDMLWEEIKGLKTTINTTKY